jgi:hypothetical protein
MRSSTSRVSLQLVRDTNQADKSFCLMVQFGRGQEESGHCSRDEEGKGQPRMTANPPKQPRHHRSLLVVPRWSPGWSEDIASLFSLLCSFPSLLFSAFLCGAGHSSSLVLYFSSSFAARPGLRNPIRWIPGRLSVTCRETP